MQKIRQEITKEQSTFKEEITKKFQKTFINEQKKLDEALARERTHSQDIEQKLITLQRQRGKEETRTQQLQRERNQLLTKRDDLERNINNCEAELAAFERLRLEKEKEGQAKREEINQKQQIRYQQLKKDYLRREE